MQERKDTKQAASSTPAGMRGYKPRRPNVTLDDVVTPEERAKRAAMQQEVVDEKAREKITGLGFAKGGAVRGVGCATKGTRYNGGY